MKREEEFTRKVYAVKRKGKWLPQVYYEYQGNYYFNKFNHQKCISCFWIGDYPSKEAKAHENSHNPDKPYKKSHPGIKDRILEKLQDKEGKIPPHRLYAEDKLGANPTDHVAR